MTPDSHVVCAFCEIPAGNGHHDRCPQARGWVTVYGQRDEHDPINACRDVHCHSCNVDEPGYGFIRCAECGHLYRTAGELRRAYRTRLAGPALGVPRWRRLWRALSIRASDISFCQECIHDF